MLNLRVGSFCSRKALWSLLNPNESFPGGGNWLTGYARDRDCLLIFANIGVPGKTGHDFPNSYEPSTGAVTWFGKPNAHSSQPTFRDLFEGRLTPEIFVRWDQKETDFVYLGPATISSYEDNVEIIGDVKTIRVQYLLGEKKNLSPPPEGIPLGSLEGGSASVKVNKYERDPRLRQICIKGLGADCKICGFDFHDVFGELGRSFCHVHHITPLSEMGGQKSIDPLTDLLPVCPNCHAMLHARSPALMPDELRAIMRNKQRLG